MKVFKKGSPKLIKAWAFYDWANSSYSTTVMAGFFPIFFEKYYSNPNDVIQSTYQLGLANSISSIFIALVSPLLGAIADRGGYRKFFLIFFTWVTAIFSMLLYFPQSGDVFFALSLFVVANVAF